VATGPVRSSEDPTGGDESRETGAYTRLLIPTSTLVKVAVFVLVTLAILWFVASLGNVLVLILLALLMAAVLSAPVGWLERRGLGRGLGAVLSVVVVLVVVSGVVALVLPPLIREVQEFIANLPQTAEGLRGRLRGSPEVYDTVVRHAEGLIGDPGGLLTGVLQFGFGFVSAIFTGVLVLTLALYFLVDGDRVRAALLRLTPHQYRERVNATLAGTGEVMRGFFIGQTILSSIFAAYTFVLLTVLGVPYAGVFAALAFFLDAIPNIGSALATVLPGLVGLSQSVTTAVIVVAAIMVYNQIENNVISPRVMSRKVNVPPVATLIAVLVGAKLLGLIGVILAIPIAGTLPVLERIWIAGRGPERTDPEQHGPAAPEEQSAA
jgi:predicted PurR-regulated permease PerM